MSLGVIQPVPVWSVISDYLNAKIERVQQRRAMKIIDLGIPYQSISFFLLIDVTFYINIYVKTCNLVMLQRV